MEDHDRGNRRNLALPLVLTAAVVERLAAVETLLSRMTLKMKPGVSICE